jgi:hypothetical protein
MPKNRECRRGFQEFFYLMIFRPVFLMQKASGRYLVGMGRQRSRRTHAAKNKGKQKQAAEMRRAVNRSI